MLDLYWDDTHRALKQTLDSWVAEHITPNADAWEEANEFPLALYREAGDAGILGLGYPEAYGGTGGDVFHALLAVEAVIRGGSPGTAVGVGIHAISVPPILALGNEAQKQRFVPPALRGEQVPCLAVTEPGAGSDVAGIRTSAVRDGEHYVLNGAKTFITSGSRADWATVLARTGEDPHGGLSIFIVERGTPGFEVGRPLKKMGWWASDTAELFFSDCRVPVENRIGEEGAGFLGIMANFVSERLVLAASCVAISQLALDQTIIQVKQREAFGRPIGRFQVVRHRVAEMAMRTAQARAFVSTVAARHTAGEDVTEEVAMAKNAAVAACSWVTDAAVQLHGGMGYMRESLVERLYRDARLYPIGGGTTEIMNELIGRRILSD